jgi:hypothetical protein
LASNQRSIVPPKSQQVFVNSGKLYDFCLFQQMYQITFLSKICRKNAEIVLGSSTKILGSFPLKIAGQR